MEMKSEELSFIGEDPGAAKLGNFINYYSFHSTKERTDALHSNMFPLVPSQSILCLDIGCNTGELSKELYSYLSLKIYPNCDIHMLAIDIDPLLIQRAKEINENQHITFTPANIMVDEDKDIINKFLISYEKNTFDIIFCFSVTMWIHINNGDHAFQDFLKYIKNISNTIIIEPQPWKCYRNAQRRMKKSGSSFPLYEKLKIRSNVVKIIEDILAKHSHRKVYESPASNWNRTIQSYQKN